MGREYNCFLVPASDQKQRRRRRKLFASSCGGNLTGKMNCGRENFTGSKTGWWSVVGLAMFGSNNFVGLLEHGRPQTKLPRKICLALHENQQSISAWC
jgi:hypothetical protein